VDVDPVGARAGGQLRDGPRLGLVARGQHGTAAQHRDAELVEDRVAQRGGAQDQLGLELARRRVEARVQDPRVRAARGQRQVVPGLEHDGVHAPPGQRVAHRRADDATAHDRDASHVRFLPHAHGCDRMRRCAPIWSS
jgi:hypothetical protein